MAQTEVPAAMVEVREQIAQWKAAHGKRSRIPGEMWAAAASWARDVGAYAASRALGVSYDALRRRVEKRRVGRLRQFVELDASAVVSSTVGAVVEMSRGDGCRMTVRLTSGPVEVGALVAAFCGRHK